MRPIKKSKQVIRDIERYTTFRLCEIFKKEIVVDYLGKHKTTINNRLKKHKDLIKFDKAYQSICDDERIKKEIDSIIKKIKNNES